MTMMERRKFRRKNRKTNEAEGQPEVEEMRPVPPLETREERLARCETENHRIALEAERQAVKARRRAEIEAARKAEDAARIQAEAQSRAKAEAEEARREQAQIEAARRAEALRMADERKRAEEQARAQAEAEAEEARHEEMRRQAEEEALKRAEAEAKRRAEAEAADRERAAAEARKREQERIKAEEARAAEKKRQAEEKARIEAKAAALRTSEQRAQDTAAKQRSGHALEDAETDTPPKGGAEPMAPFRLEQPQPPAVTTDPWSLLKEFPVNEAHLGRNRIITASRDDPAHTAFDVLRTRLLQALQQHGWKRVAITSPTKDCGKTFTAANLAISMSRQENCRTLLLDCDMRRPALHKVMGAPSPGAIGDMLRGTIAPQDHLLRLGKNSFHAGHNIAFGFNNLTEPYAAELLQDPRSRESLDRIDRLFEPDVMLFDLPPALYYDDVIAFRPLFDGVLLVVGGGITTQKEIKEVERRLGDTTPLLGMVLNRAENTEINRYRY